MQQEDWPPTSGKSLTYTSGKSIHLYLSALRTASALSRVHPGSRALPFPGPAWGLCRGSAVPGSSREEPPCFCAPVSAPAYQGGHTSLKVTNEPGGQTLEGAPQYR